MSPDYEPTTDHNWREDLTWRADSAVIAVSVAERYVFAYNFDSDQALDDHETIRALLASSGAP